MDRWKGKVAVVTGASSGIGAVISRELVKAGVIVIGLARRTGKIEMHSLSLAQYPGQLHARFCDITQKESIEAAFRWIDGQFGGVNILVNNAGILRCTFILAQENDKDLQDVMTTNFDGFLNCTRAAYRIMRRNNADGHIININSILGHSAFIGGSIVDSAPLLNLYVPAKCAVLGMVEVIRQELNYMQIKKVKISTISPSFVRSNLMASGGFPQTDEVYENFEHLHPDDIADAVLFLLGTSPNVQIQDMIVRALGEAF